MARKQQISNGNTRDRILEVAENLFAQKGFEAVSIREIIKDAGCNIASVNYHFKNKQNLYDEVFQERWLPRSARLRKHLNDFMAQTDAATLSNVLNAMAQAFLTAFPSENERQIFLQLIAREMTHPTQTFDVMIEKSIRPLITDLVDLVRQFMPSEMDDEQMFFKMICVVAMLLQFNFAQEALGRLTGHISDQNFTLLLLNQLVEFSLHGLGAKDVN